MNSMKSYGLMAFLIGVILVSFGVFTVQETERAIVLRLGKMLQDPHHEPKIFTPGLNFKIPMLDTVRFFDTRLQTVTISSSRIVTREKKDVIVDLFVKWRIEDFPTFFTTTSGMISRADTLLRQKIVDGVRAEFGKRSIQEVVSGERADIMQNLLREASGSAKELGIQVVDTRIKRIDLPEEVSDSVYERMRSERQRIAAEHRAMGQARADIERAKADAKVTVLLANAQETAKAIRGEGDALAAGIYAKAYSNDPEFYKFYRSLEAYNATFKSKEDILLIKPEGEFFQYLHRADQK